MAGALLNTSWIVGAVGLSVGTVSMEDSADFAVETLEARGAVAMAVDMKLTLVPNKHESGRCNVRPERNSPVNS
jgi:hypothetical protein